LTKIKHEERIVLVTGASKGIGLAIVKKYLSKGYVVIAHYRQESPQLKELSIEANGKLCPLQADLSDEDETKSMLKESMQLFGRIDILINNAGTYSMVEEYDQLTTQQFLDVLRVNLLVPFEMSQFMIGSMMERGFGRIVNISSISVEHGGAPKSVNYTCSKAAIEALTKSYAKLGAENNVLINAIRVGLTDTGFHSKNPTKNMKERIQMVPMKRIATADEIANVICFYGSEENSFTTGSIINVSGGE
jgi:NAD(P)-dependent dehydrogenase (short-subunit alcohol dehydrogenase family)